MSRNGLTSAIGMGLNVFSQDELETIHKGACHILKRTGVLVEMEEAAERLSSAGARVSKKDPTGWSKFLNGWLQTASQVWQKV